MGGRFTEPKKQNTQQSPGLGRSKVLQLMHSWKNWQASVGHRLLLGKTEVGTSQQHGFKDNSAHRGIRCNS
jgi:hypothetical protein